MTPELIKVLLVEDDPGDAFWIKELLEGAGKSWYRFELQHFTRLVEALQYLAGKKPDAILLDLGLPDSQGMQTLKSILDVAPALPVVVLTGLADEDFGAAAVQQGAQDYLIKDQFNQDQLVRSLRYALERKLAEEALKRARSELEQRVVERTADLRHTVKQLQWEITERQRVEEELRESEERLRFLASQLLIAQETERSRLSRELHDDLGQALLVLKMQLNAILRACSPKQELRQRLEEAVEYVLEVIDKVRRLSRNMSPPALEEVGLVPALRNLFEEFRKYHYQNMIIEADLDEVKDILPKEANILIFRITQEFLSNVHKHAEATRVAVAIKALPEKVTITLEDNGKGFFLDEVRDQVKGKGGLGLVSIEERLRMLGSQFNLTSQAGKGTRLQFEIKLTPEKKLPCLSGF